MKAERRFFRPRFLIALCVRSVFSVGTLWLSSWADPLWKPNPDSQVATMVRSVLSPGLDAGIVRRLLATLAYWAPSILSAVACIRIAERREERQHSLLDGAMGPGTTPRGANVASKGPPFDLPSATVRDRHSHGKDARRAFLNRLIQTIGRSFVWRTLASLIVGVAFGWLLFVLASILFHRGSVSSMFEGFVPAIVPLIYSDIVTYPLGYRNGDSLEWLILFFADLTFIAPACICFIALGEIVADDANDRRCVGCGYSTIGLDSLRCPECGHLHSHG